MSYRIGKTKLEDLYFGAKRYNPNSKKFEAFNVFDSLRVRWSVACYVANKKEIISEPLIYCFGDLWSRCEYEMVMSDWPNQETVEKHDVWDMYIIPNKDYLMSLVNSVPASSAKKFLAEYRKRYKK